MGVSIRTSRHTRVYVPFWAAILFWLIVGPIVLAGLVGWGLLKLIIAIVQMVQAARAARQ